MYPNLKSSKLRAEFEIIASVTLHTLSDKLLNTHVKIPSPVVQLFMFDELTAVRRSCLFLSTIEHLIFLRAVTRNVSVFF